MTRSQFYRLLAVLVPFVLVFSGNAVASSCNSSFYSQYDSCKLNSSFCSPYSSPEEFAAAHPNCFPGSSSTSQAQVSSSSFVQIAANSTAVLSRMLSEAGSLLTSSAPVQGMAAGGKTPWNVWGNVTQNDTRQSFQIGINSIRHDLDVTNAVIGVDYAIAPGMVLGMSGAFDRGSGNTQPTAAAAWQGSTVKGYSFAPYLGYQISKELAFDASVGLGSGKTSTAGGVDSEGDRVFFAANLGYAKWFKEVQVTGKVGYLHGEEKFSDTKVNGATMAGTAQKNKLDRFQFGAQVAYWMGNGMQPYAGLSYMTDGRSSSAGGVDPVGKNAWQWALGVNFFSLSSGVNGGIAFTQEEGRTNQKNNALTANIGLRF